MRRVLMMTAALLAGCASTRAADAPRDDEVEDEAVRAAIVGLADHAADVLLTDSGMGRSDYEVVRSRWSDYEPHWHTGQMILALVRAHEATGEARYLEAARRAGDWWVSTEFVAHHPFAGLVDAAHGNKLGRLINFTTISDGTPGLFALSRATGEPRYADAATRSGTWLYENAKVDRPGGEGLFYNLFDPATGAVLMDWNAHERGVERDAAAALADPSPVNEVARPNIEGFLFADMCEHTGDGAWCDRFAEQARHALERQDANGLWMAFEPNDPESGKVHPRFNIWNAEALVVAYEVTGDEAFLEGAARTARFFDDLADRRGTIYYRSKVDGSAERSGVTGSAVAFNGLLMLRLAEHGMGEFDQAIERTARWVLANRYADDHPDPNLAGAVVNTRLKSSDDGVRLIQRDVGTTFGLRFLAAYAARG